MSAHSGQVSTVGQPWWTGERRTHKVRTKLTSNHTSDKDVCKLIFESNVLHFICQIVTVNSVPKFAVGTEI